MYSELIPIAAVIFGVLLVGYTVGKITGLIRLWMEQRHRQKYGDTVNKRLIQAFKEFKYDTEQRLQQLEAIVAEEPPQLEEESERTIEIEDHESESTGEEDRNLRNMLNN